MEKKIYIFNCTEWEDNDFILLRLTEKQANLIRCFLKETNLNYEFYLANIIEFNEEV